MYNFALIWQSKGSMQSNREPNHGLVTIHPEPVHLPLGLFGTMLAKAASGTTLFGVHIHVTRMFSAHAIAE